MKPKIPHHTDDTRVPCDACGQATYESEIIVSGLDHLCRPCDTDKRVDPR